MYIYIQIFREKIKNILLQETKIFEKFLKYTMSKSTINLIASWIYICINIYIEKCLKYTMSESTIILIETWRILKKWVSYSIYYITRPSSWRFKNSCLDSQTWSNKQNYGIRNSEKNFFILYNIFFSTWIARLEATNKIGTQKF